MAAVTICNDSGAQENKVCHCFHCFPIYLPWSEVVDISWAILFPVCASSSPAFCMMYSAYKLNNQGDNIQPWCTPFPIFNQSTVPCPVLTVASWPAYRFLGRQVRQSGIPISFKNFPQFVVIHIVKAFGVVNKAEVDVFLELSCFFNDPTDVDNLISGSSAFSKTSLNIWRFTVHKLLKPGLENFEHYFTSTWDECNCAVVWAFFGIGWLILRAGRNLGESCWYVL